MARLVVESGDNSGMIYSVSGPSVLLGRGADCAIRVIDRRVSRHHARISHTDSAYVLDDLQSRNGTWLNDQPMVGRASLRNGDTIAVGGTKFIFELDSNELGTHRTRVARVRMATGLQHHVHAEKPVDGDTAPVIPNSAALPESTADPITRLKVLYQVSDALRGEVNTESLLWKVMHLIWRVMAPDRGIILLDNEEGESNLRPVVVKSSSIVEEEIVISQAVVEKCLQHKAAILLADAPADPHFSKSESIIRGKIRSILCAPLVAQGRPFGVIYLDIQDNARSADYSRVFSTDDLDLMTGIANQAALALDNARLHMEALKHQRMERELEIARDIQDQLLSTSFPPLNGVDFAAVCKPARQVGGDYYDVFDVGNGCTAVVVGDASGKGVPAAISIAMLRTAIRARVRSRLDLDLADILAALNTAFCHDTFRDNYLTAFILLYCPNGQIVYTNAGQVPPLLLRANGTLELLTAGGPIIAAVPDAKYQSGRLILKPDDVIVIYSDGVTDTHGLSGELFGADRLVQALRACSGESARKICDYISESVVRFRETREPFDDMTMVVLKAGESENLTQQA
jgi:serine phosphatase RsbU (regulator of sigma subunit)